MISIVRSGPKHRFEQCELEQLASLLADSKGESCTIWVDLDNPTPDEETQILDEIFHFHPLAILDCRQERLTPRRGDHLPKVEDYGEYLFVIINAIVRTPGRSGRHSTLHTQQVNAFLGENFIVTHHYEPSPSIANTSQLCQKNALVIERGPDYIYHLILDNIVDQLTPILDSFDEEIEHLENEVFQNHSRNTLPKILGMKREIFRLRRITTYQREMVNRLSRGEFPLVTEQEIAYYRNVYDHLVRAAELSESYRDVLTSLLDAYLSMASNRMNEIMKVLTIFSTFFLPLTFIAGIYGMNFTFMPELHWRYGYLFAGGLMLGTAVSMFYFFRKKKWM